MLRAPSGNSSWALRLSNGDHASTDVIRMQESVDRTASDLPPRVVRACREEAALVRSAVSHGYHVALACPREARVLKRGLQMMVLRDIQEAAASGGG